MRILRIQFENLNSLPHGDIDLEHGAIAEAGIFAITGPTGAGKSTLLDALTLALYGRAARYGKAPNPENMMSRHTGACRAEVLFEVPKGRYLARWELRRSRNKPEGKLQPARRTVTAEGGEVLAGKIDDADRVIEELTGLDYERFRRSVLLAQGEFSQFFKSKPQERAALLESLTGTAVYSELSQLAYREATEREAALEARREALGRVSLLSGEERAAREGQIESFSAEIERLDGERKAAVAKMETGRQLLARLAEEAALVRREAELAEAARQAAPQRERLRLHRLAAPFAPALETFQAMERQHATALIQVGEATAASEAARRELAGGLLAAQHLAAARVREAEGAVSDRQAQHHKLCDQLAEAEKAEEAAQAKVAEAVAHLEQEHRGRTLETAIDDFKKLEDRHQTLLALQTAIQKRDAAAAEAARLADEEAALEGEIETARREKTDTETEAEAQAALLEAARTALEFETRIASMAEQRAQLEEGQPCPLCGSLDHPYRRGTLPPNSPIEEAHRNLAAAQIANSTAAREARLAAENLTRAEVRQAEIQKRRGELRWQQTADHEAFERMARAAHVFTAESLEEAFADLEKKRTDHAALTQQIRTAEAARNAAEKAWLGLQGRVTLLREKRAGMETALAGLKERLETVAKEAERLASPKWAEGLDLAVPIAAPGSARVRWNTLEEAREALEYLRAAQAEARATLQERQSQLEELGKAVEAQAGEIRARLVGSAFENIDALRAARLEPAEAAAMERREAEAAAAAQALGGQLRQVRGQLESLRGNGAPEGEALSALEGQCRELESQLAAATEARAALRAELDRDEQARRSQKAELAALEEEAKKLGVWTRLRGMIGSASGALFQEFAQGLSLDILVRHANRHLSRLSDRYRLRRVESGELTLEVVDLHQAGAIRPMASLSGGESFLASLALALGLSDLAGRNVRIDSLFIDEGFGSLDSDTLDLAVSALDSLRLANKTVGIISHVEVLKERIPVQIRVEKRLGGVSKLRLPGDLAA